MAQESNGGGSPIDDSKEMSAQDIIKMASGVMGEQYLVVDNNKFITPRIEDLQREDFQIDIDNVTSIVNKNNKQNMEGFYKEPLPTNKLGYDADKKIFMIKATPVIHMSKDGKTVDPLHAIDGDTVEFSLNSIVDGGAFIGPDGTSYNNLKEYMYKHFPTGSDITKDDLSGLNFGIRFVGYDAPEVPHYRQVTVTDEYANDKSNRKKMTRLEADSSPSAYYQYEKNILKGSRPTIDFIKIFDGETNVWHEVLKTEPYEGFKDMKLLTVVSTDESPIEDLEYAQQGEGARQMMLNMIRKAGPDDIRIIIDAQSVNKAATTYPIPSFTKDIVEWLKDPISYWVKRVKRGLATDYRHFNAPGQDIYGRFIGAVYVRDGAGWINTGKRICANFDRTIINPTWAESPLYAQFYNFVSDAFNSWSYNYKDTKIIDSMIELSKKLDDRKEVQKSAAKVDFDSMKDYTMMIGDSLFMVPPTSIRTISRNTAERMPLLRARGSVTKGNPHYERLIEMTLYFNNDDGINGVPYVETLPNNKKKTYYMNGLRSLIAMFKFTPFLPIDNTYINNILNIEAVSLVNLQLTTVPGYPSCIAATLTLEEFNYRMFMPEIPAPNADNGEAYDVNLFASTINFKVMRWYYQRAIEAGNKLRNLKAGSDDYIKTTLGSKTALQPMKFGESYVEFFIPNKDDLTAKLQTKLNAMSTPLQNIPPLTAEGKAVMVQLAQAYKVIKSTMETDKDVSAIINKINNEKTKDGKAMKLSIYEEKGGREYAESGTGRMNQTRLFKYTGDPHYEMYQGKPSSHLIIDEVKTRTDMIREYMDKLYDVLTSKLVGFKKANLVTGIDMTETSSKNNLGFLDLKINIKLKLENLILTNDDRLNFIKTMGADMDSVESSFFTGKELTITMSAQFEDKKCGLCKNPLQFDFSCDGMTMLAKIAANIDLIAEQDPINSVKDSATWDANSTIGAQQQQQDIKASIDKETASSIKFDKYPIGDVKVLNLSCSMGNTMTKMALQGMDGYASQFFGGQDTVIELTLQTKDEAAVTMLNDLPRKAAQFVRDYKLVLNAWPLRINSEITRLFGVHEVLVESVDIATIPNQPGVYNIAMRLVSVDRTQRNKEALQKINETNNSGSRGNTGKVALELKNYFEMENSLAKVEIYPDLELPTLEELHKEAGFKLAKYNASAKRVFPDPDFYFAYGHILGSQLFKETIIEYLKNNKVTDRNSDLSDSLSSLITLTPTQDKAFSILHTNAQAKALKANQADVKKAINKLYEDQIKHVNTVDEIPYSSMLEMAMKLDVYQGWDISDKIKCIFREPIYSGSNEGNDNAHYIAQLKLRANKMKEVIKAELEKPISTIKDPIAALKDKSRVITYQSNGSHSINANYYTPGILQIMASPQRQDDYIKQGIESFVDDFFSGEASTGYKILKAVGIADHIDNTEYKKQLVMLLQASAAAQTGEVECDQNISKYEWRGKLFRCSNVNGLQSFADEDKVESKKGKKGRPVPIARVGMTGQGLTGIYAAASLDDALQYGINYGPFQIQNYSKQEIIELSGQAPVVDKEKYFLDPFYRNLDEQDSSGKDVTNSMHIEAYKTFIMIDPYTAAYAFTRNALYWFSKMLEDDIIPSMYDVIGDEIGSAILEKTINETTANVTDRASAYAAKDAIDRMEKGVPPITSTKPEAKSSMDYVNDYYASQAAKTKAVTETKTDTKTTTSTDTKKATAAAEEAKAAVEKQSRLTLDHIQAIIKKSSMPIAIGKLYAAFGLALAPLDGSLYGMIQKKEYAALNEMTRQFQTVTSDYVTSTTSLKSLRKYTKALIGYGLIPAQEDFGSKGQYVSEEIDNAITEKIYLACAEDPNQYLFDSFYDMMLNDKRGRMSRAFPVFYMVMIDEGRDIGIWHLHDNFYNTSAISELQITKSRKLAADTVSITMSNMFTSYTTDDEDIKDGYTYSFKDAWSSLFSPRKLFVSEEIRRSAQTEVNRVRLQPGVRLHIRLGYSADASQLPIAFNGVVAEVSAGDVVQIVAQGDGVELSNPIMSNVDGEDIQNQDNFIIERMIQNWLTEGATPRTILTSLLTTKDGFVRKFINEKTNGRFFNDNPYGITHFGDPYFNPIFSNGEVVQNIYEATAQPSWGGKDSAENGMRELYDTQSPPKISTHVFGKSYWDIMQICAAVSPDFIASTVPFGFRSSIFYGAPRYYYAYEYEQNENGIIKEKRKPFQQYHIYNSYSDILGNAIKASDQDVRTCAVGLYTETGILGREHPKRVGPMWVDFDIYPEKQKTMTVDTQFLAKGSAFGDIIPFLNGITGDLTHKDGGVFQDSYQIAWRMTAAALKNSVKDMYQGELIVMGDPTVKPYDKVWFDDIFQRMQGGIDVEAVVQSMSIETGYTTSVFADCVACVDDRYEQLANLWIAPVVAKAGAAYTALVLPSMMFSSHSKPFLTAIQHWLKKGGAMANDAIDSIVKIVGKEELLTNDTGFIKSLKGTGNKFMDLLGVNEIDAFVYRVKDWEKNIGNLKKIGNMDELSSYYAKIAKTLKQIDADDLIKQVTAEAIDADVIKAKRAKEVLKELNTFQDGIKSVSTKLPMSKENLKFFEDTLEDMLKNMGEVVGPEIEAQAAKRTSITEAQQLIKDLKASKATSVADIAENMNKVSNVMTTIGDEATDAAKMAKLLEESDDAVRIFKEGVGAIDNIAAKSSRLFKISGSVLKTGTMMSSVLGLGLEIAVTQILTSYAYEFVERWMRNLQVLQVFPLKKDSKVYTAGLDGSKGIIVGSPTYDDPGLIEGAIGRLLSTKTGENAWIGNAAIGLLASADMVEIAAKYRERSNMPVPGTSVSGQTVVQDLLKTVAADNTSKGNAYNAMLLSSRVTVLNSPESNSSFMRYSIQNTKNVEINADIVNNMVPISSLSKFQDMIKNGTLSLIHDETFVGSDKYHKGSKHFSIQSKGVKYNYICDDGIIDLPILRPDAMVMLEKIVDEVVKELSNTKKYGKDALGGSHGSIVIKSALRVGKDANKKDTWRSTGFVFTISTPKFDGLEKVMKDIQTSQTPTVKSVNTGKITDGKVFHFLPTPKAKSKNTFDVFVYPPKI